MNFQQVYRLSLLGQLKTILVSTIYHVFLKSRRSYSAKVGFRNIHVSGETFLVNAAIKLKGMNRHDYNPKNGRVVSRKEIEKIFV